MILCVGDLIGRGLNIEDDAARHGSFRVRYEFSFNCVWLVEAVVTRVVEECEGDSLCTRLNHPWRPTLARGDLGVFAAAWLGCPQKVWGACRLGWWGDVFALVSKRTLSGHGFLARFVFFV